uniref:Uncharacterized protein n=1 Tax=Setaria italica TaxID=4555 RepID=K4AMJ6_SETIT
MEQGVLEAIRISCASYPTKRTFDELIIDRFGMLAPELVDRANAVRLIQRRIKTHLMRKEFIKLRKASIKSQKFWRGISSLLRALCVFKVSKTGRT